MGNKATYTFYLYIIQQPLKDDFLYFFLFLNKFSLQNFRSGVSKKEVFFGRRF